MGKAVTKESFVLFKSFYAPCEGLELEQKGMLFDALFKFQIDGKEPEKESPIYSFFLFFKNQFRLDNIKYQQRTERNRNNGSLGGRPRKNKDLNESGPKEAPYQKPKNPAGKTKPKKGDKDKEKDNVTDNEKKILSLTRIRSLVKDSTWDCEFFAEAWYEWLEHKKAEKGHKYKTEKTELRAIRMLWTLAEFEGKKGHLDTAVKIIAQSMDENWSGLFKLKTERNGNGKKNGANGSTILTDNSKY